MQGTSSSAHRHPESITLPGVTPYPAACAQRYRDRGYWRGETLSDMFFRAVKTFPDDTVVIEGGVALTYQELGDKVLSLAQGFLDLGISRSDRVVVQIPNIIQYLEVVFALFEIGALPVFALPAHRKTEIEHFCVHAEAKAYITTDFYEGFSFKDLAKEMEECIPSLEFCVIVDIHDSCETFNRHYKAPLHHEPRCSPADIAFLQLSGGTTGKPKLIPRTHDDYFYTIRESVKLCDLRRSSVHLVVLPISHNFTMSSPGVLGCIHAGATIVLAPHGSPDLVFPLIERHGVTSVSMVPPIALLWLNSSLVKTFDLSSLEVIQVGGAKFSEEAAKRVRGELGCTLQQVFGMAEGLVNYTRLADDEQKIVSTQGLKISPDDEILIIDHEGAELTAGKPGQLLTRGPYTIRGYYRADEHNAKTFTEDGFYMTGDLVVADEQGYLTVVGRVKDQINRGGEKISPEEVENLLLSHDLIHDVSVVGVMDETLGEKVKAFVIPRKHAEPAEISPFRLKRFLRQKGIAEFKIPELYEVVEEFPTTFAMKVSKKSQRSDERH